MYVCRNISWKAKPLLCLLLLLPFCLHFWESKHCFLVVCVWWQVLYLTRGCYIWFINLWFTLMYRNIYIYICTHMYIIMYVLNHYMCVYINYFVWCNNVSKHGILCNVWKKNSTHLSQCKLLHALGLLKWMI